LQKAGRRVHRRRDRAARTPHGPRRRDHQRRQRHGGGQNRRVQEAGIGVAATPSEMADTLLNRQAGAPLNWAPVIRLNAISLPFYSELRWRMLMFSFFSFAVTLGLFYLCLLLLSSVNGPVSDAEPGQRLVRRHLGRLERWPIWVKLLLPLVVMTALWCALNPLLLWRIDLVPRVPAWHLLAQGAVIGLSAYFALKFLVVGFLALYVLNSYVYLGDSAFLNFVNTTTNGMLRPLRRLPLRVGRVDLAPLAGMALVLLVVCYGPPQLRRLNP
jgi:uncharacterized protein YggT (Ycf19 family)